MRGKHWDKRQADASLYSTDRVPLNTERILGYYNITLRTSHTNLFHEYDLT